MLRVQFKLIVSQQSKIQQVHRFDEFKTVVKDQGSLVEQGNLRYLTSNIQKNAVSIVVGKLSVLFNQTGSQVPWI